MTVNTNPIFDLILERLNSAEQCYATYRERFEANMYNQGSASDKPWHSVIDENYNQYLPIYITAFIKLLGIVPTEDQSIQLIHIRTGTTLEVMSVSKAVTYFIENEEEVKELINQKRILNDFTNRQLDVVSTAGEICRALNNIPINKK